MGQMDFTSAYSEDLSSVLRLTTWERNLKGNRQTAEPKKQTGPVLWTWPSIGVQNNNNTSGPETKFLWSFFFFYLLEDFKEGCTREAWRKQKDILLKGGWQFFNLWESLQLPKGCCKEHVYLQFNFYHTEASALLVLLWCFGPKLFLNPSDCSLTFTYRSHALACLFCGCRLPVYRCM